MPFVLDNTVVTGWYLADQATDYSHAIACRLEQDKALVPPLRQMELAMHHQLSSYDAAYLELALRHGLPIATQDARLQRAAKAAAVNIAG